MSHYTEVNPSYGTKQDLKNLVEKVHQAGLKIIIDAVLNHTAWDNALINNPQFYIKDENNQIMPPLPDWSDVAALDYDNPEVRTHMLNILKYWLQEFDLDGFRFDASDFIPVDFWREVRRELLKVKPDIVLLGEGEKPEALRNGFDLDYDWNLKNALDNVIIEGAPATATIKKVLSNEKQTFPSDALHLRFVDNHDERRAISRYGEKGVLAASVLIFTLNGVPLIYNGMEVGDTTESKAPALFEKMPVFWKCREIRPEFEPFFTHLIELRKSHRALWNGETEWIENSDEDRILTYLRKSKDETLFIAINLSNRPFDGTVKLNGKFENLWQNTTPQSLPALTLKPWEFLILK